MDEFISREATIKRIKKVYCVGCNSYNGVRCRACGTGDAIDIIEDAPTVDAVPVVRCKDCKHRFKDSWCEYVDDDDNFYCARGERKEGAENG